MALTSSLPSKEAYGVAGWFCANVAVAQALATMPMIKKYLQESAMVMLLFNSTPRQNKGLV
jgi:hypothetical protein